jgi:hypothetical protein
MASNTRFAASIDGWVQDACQDRSTLPVEELNVNVARFGFFVMAR